MSSRTLQAALDDPQLPSAAVAALAHLRRHAMWSAAAFACAAALWAQLAPLSGAVVATGFLKSELNRKTLQHQEGGLVTRLAVRDGQHVKAGDVLAVIGDVRADAGFDLLQDQHRAERLHRARLEAEVDFAPALQVPAGLKAAPELLARERKVFAARRATLDQQLSALRSQADAAASQVNALHSQIVATEAALQLAKDELALNQGLVEQGFMQKTRLMTLQRTVAEYQARLGQQRGDEAEAQQRIEDLRLRMAQARNTYQQQAADELKDSTLRLREMDEKLRPSADLVDRQAVKAPVSGTIMGLRLTTVGSAIGPRETLMELVPDDERLVVEAHIRPQDIEHVRLGGSAEVHFTAFDNRATPRLPATVAFVSPDRVTDPQTGAAWYVAHLQVDDAALAEHPAMRLQTGMPVEVFVATPPRSLLRYLLEPIDAFRQRSLREP